MMKKLVLFICISILCNSCIPIGFYVHNVRPSYIKKGITCYDGKDPNIDSLINISGCYHEIIISKRKDYYFDKIYETPIDTSWTNIMFFKDGICVANFPNFGDKNDLSLYFKELGNSLVIKTSFYKIAYWGKYIISNDTIIVQCVQRPFSSDGAPSWYAYEYWYKIIDKNTIQRIYEKPICNKSEFNYKNSILKNMTYLPAKFIPIDVLPTSDNWVKKKKWFWCNKEDWKAYMEKIKQKE
jgi:hypothetical protein